ncbi:MAG TPA: alpha-amylase family glycosyl hydrolase [Flavisolibacter sp.]|jgi:glycosidase|nr:alpha-amylase family glycosyl hydrolase [Flavisolibacter sp.]
MRKLTFLLAAFLLHFVLFAQNSITAYPTHWWTGMKNPKLQVMLRGEDIAQAKSIGVNYPGLRVDKVTKVANDNYVFIDLTILPSAKPGTARIRLVGSNGTTEIPYTLKARSRENGKTRIRGVDATDFIYLIMPDRFSNGDPSNDRVPGMRDQSLNRDTIFERHGGDLKGVQNKLPYLQDLGVTAIWLNPVIENDMPNRTEHGYAFTDHYRIDRRIGGEKAYHDLVNAIHARGMKIIQDAVYNHVGLEHFLFRDQPDSSWFHRWPRYTQTTYKDQVLFDPYASAADKKLMSDGWFVPSMPDINHDNPLFATFLIQHAIWSTEEFGLDGWRIDTYAYNDLEFMNRCNKALLDEYPQLHLFGETWVHGVVNQAYFTENRLNVPFKSNLPAVTDFQTHLYGILPALKESFGWTEGVNRLYTTLAQDLVYKDPLKHVNFLDNHDKTRFFSEIGEDFEKYKMGIGWLLTARGIPQMYYGTEVLMKGVANPDGWVRLDFPGGWPGDKENKFEKSGRTAREDSAYTWVRTIANYRRQTPALQTGKFMQYVPEEGVYTYFRYDNNQTVMVVMNTANSEKSLGLNRFTERTKGFSTAKNIVTGASAALNGQWTVPGKSIWILELGK